LPRFFLSIDLIGIYRTVYCYEATLCDPQCDQQYAKDGTLGQMGLAVRPTTKLSDKGLA